MYTTTFIIENTNLCVSFRHGQATCIGEALAQLRARDRQKIKKITTCGFFDLIGVLKCAKGKHFKSPIRSKNPHMVI